MFAVTNFQLELLHDFRGAFVFYKEKIKKFGKITTVVSSALTSS